MRGPHHRVHFDVVMAANVGAVSDWRKTGDAAPIRHTSTTCHAPRTHLREIGGGGALPASRTSYCLQSRIRFAVPVWLCIAVCVCREACAHLSWHLFVRFNNAEREHGNDFLFLVVVGAGGRRATTTTTLPFNHLYLCQTVDKRKINWGVSNRMCAVGTSQTKGTFGKPWRQPAKTH